MNEREIGRKIVQTLDRGPALPAGVLARLEAGRARAVESQRRVEPSLALEIADGIAARLAGPSQWFTQVLLPAMLLICGLIGIHSWQDSQQRARAAADAAEVDTRLLQSDLPIDAYLDHRFQAWLERSSE